MANNRTERGTLTRVVFSGAIALIAALVAAGTVNADIPQKPKEYLVTKANYQTVWVGVLSFASVERRMPQSYDELMQSPYSVVRAGDLINPYTNLPVKVRDLKTLEASISQTYVPGSPALPGKRFAATTGTDVPYGDVVFFNDGKRMSIVFVVDPVGDRKNFELLSSPDFARELPSLDPEPQGMTCCNLRQGLAQSKVADDLQKRMSFICSTIDGIAARYTHEIGRLSTWDNLKKDALEKGIFNLTIMNPYTGQPIQDVSRDTPSPGNFTWGGLPGYADDPNAIYGLEPFCYDGSSKPVFPPPDIRETIEQYINDHKESPNSPAHFISH